MTDTISSTKFPLKTMMIACCGLVVWWFLRTEDASSVSHDGKKTHQKVVYDVKNWQNHPTSFGSSDNFEQIKSMLGATATKSDALDFDGFLADKYSYTSASEPPLYVIESDKLFEINWYFASPKDSDRIKASSITYAKKAYAIATALYGYDGAILMEQMLSEQTIAPEFLGRYHLRHASCQNYNCRLIIQK